MSPVCQAEQHSRAAGERKDPVKKGPRSKGPKADQKAELRCPFFKSDFTGICTGHKLPYARNETEKRQYCLSAEFHTCSIFGKSSPEQEKK